jgi:hypothetical protein
MRATYAVLLTLNELTILTIAWRRVQVMKLLIMQFSQPPVTSSLFGANILLNTLFSNTLSLCSSLNVRETKFRKQHLRHKSISVTYAKISSNLKFAYFHDIYNA